jgi:hypothetical protein
MGQHIVLTLGSLGGAGDALLYSTLPERFSKLGFDVYLDSETLTRNPETHDLIFSKNPYILGMSDKKPKLGHCNQGKFYEIANRFPIGCIEAMERAHGLLPPYSIAPKIYYEPQPFKIDLSNAVLCEFNSISSEFKPEAIMEHIQRMNERFMYGRQAYIVKFGPGVSRPNAEIDGPAIVMNSIYEYVDAIASCSAWIGSEAGGQALAAAVRGEHDVYDMAARPEIVALISPRTFNSRGYTFRGVDYRVTTKTNYDGDYWNPHEVPYERYMMIARKTVEDARNEWNSTRGGQ